MKVIQHGEKFTFEVEGETAKEIFDKLVTLNSTFSIPNCEVTYDNQPSSDYEPRLRVVTDKKNPKKTYTYREYRCNVPPFARLAMGENLEGGGLFPKRWNKETQQEIGVNGWEHVSREPEVAHETQEV